MGHQTALIAMSRVIDVIMGLFFRDSLTVGLSFVILPSPSGWWIA